MNTNKALQVSTYFSIEYHETTTKILQVSTYFFTEFHETTNGFKKETGFYFFCAQFHLKLEK